MSPSHLRIIPATSAHIPRLTDIQFSAFAHDPYQEALHPNYLTDPSVREVANTRALKAWNTDPTAYWIVCQEEGGGGGGEEEEDSSISSSSSSSSSFNNNNNNDTNNNNNNNKNTEKTNTKILGFALWNIYTHPRAESEWLNLPITIDWCTGRRAEIAHNFLRMNQRVREKTWGGRPYVLLNLLCVHRDAQRRGAGTMLVEWGVKRAEELGLGVHLEASPDGFQLYRRMGFRRVGVEVVTREEWDGERDMEYIVMVRDPGVGKVDGV